MASTPPLQVPIIANVSGLLDGLATGTAGIKQFAGAAETSLGGLGKTIENLKAPFLALAGLAAGGALFKGVIDTTVAWNMEIDKLARTLGVTTGQASTLKVALQGLGIDQETYISAAQKMTAQIAKGGQGFAALGISTKDAHGNLKPMTDLMAEAVDKINSMKQGTDQMTAAQLLWGKGAQQAMDLLRLTSERMAAAREEAESLHLIVGPEGVAKTEQYEEGMRKVSLIQTSLQVQIGNALLPTLLKLGTWLGSTGPSMAQGLMYGIQGVIQIFYALKATVETITIAMVAFFSQVIEGAMTAGSVLYKVLTGDFKGAWQAAKSGFQDIKSEAEAAADGIGTAWKEMATNSKALWADQGPVQDGKVGAQGAATVDPTKGKDTSMELLQQFKQQLEEKKAAEENWFTWSTQEELAFWQSKEAQVQVGSKAYVAILTEENKLRRKIAEEDQAKQTADFALKMTKVREGSEERVALAQEEAARVGAVYGTDSKQYLQALAVVERAQQAHADKMKQVDAAIQQDKRDALLAGLDLEISILENQANAGLLSQTKYIAQLKAYENEKYQIQLQAAQRAAALEEDPVKHQQKLNQLAQVERQFNARMLQIDRQALAQRRAQWTNFFQSMTGGFQTAIQGLIQGTMTWSDAFNQVLDQALQGIINFFAQWAIEEAIKWAVSLVLGKEGSEAQIRGQSSTYAVSAMQSVASIPYVGWAMAPAVGEAAYAQGMSFLGRASAMGGWDRVPTDQVAQIHKDEMVMSPPLAGFIRDTFASASAPAAAAAGAGGGDTHIHISAMDGKSVQQFVNRNQGAFIQGTNAAAKNRRTQR